LTKRKIIFVTPEDMYYNHVIYGNMLVESSLRCTNIERNLIRILQKSKETLNRNSIQARVRQQGMNVSAHMITKHMAGLGDLGYVEIFKVGSSPATYGVGQLFKDFVFEINWNEVISESIKNMKKHYPEVADKYIEKFCKEPKAIDPFSGVEVSIKDIEVKQPVKSELEKHFVESELSEEPVTSDQAESIDEEIV